MIIAASQEGQLCNRLFHFSHLISHCITNRERLWYPFFHEYVHYFPNIKGNSLNILGVSIYSNRLIQLLLPKFTWLLFKYYQTPPFLKYIKSDSDIICLSSISNDANKKRLVVLDGWLFRDVDNFNNNAELIRKLFQFQSEVISTALNVVVNLKTSSEVCLVGVHIRRGDYAQWQNGIYYFDDIAYLSAITQISSVIREQGKIATFIICSNEPISPASPLLKLENVTLNNGSAIEDLCLLSKCDLLIGPPSTFTIWASFFGSVPLCYLEKKFQTIDIAQFSVRHC